MMIRAGVWKLEEHVFQLSSDCVQDPEDLVPSPGRQDKLLTEKFHRVSLSYLQLLVFFKSGLNL